MKKYIIFIFFLCVICSKKTYGQNNTIDIISVFKPESNELKVTQVINYYNSSNTVLNEIYLHNWPNAYRDKNTPLAKRFIENYSKSFHFAKDKHRGFGKINSISVDYEIATWEVTEKNPDFFKIILNKPLQPKENAKISATYVVRLPKDKFTKYGVNTVDFNLRYWYLTPAIFNNKWNVYNNLDLDDLYVDFFDYNINLILPISYKINTDLNVSKDTIKDVIRYNLTGKHKTDIELNITQENSFIEFQSEPVAIITNLTSEKLNTNVQTDILNRELLFIQSYLGDFPHEKLLINKIEYDKNPVYGFNQLPSFLAPFSDTFEWDIQFFKVLSKKYIENIFVFNQREDAWLADAIQTFLMIKYVEKYYPEIKAIGNVSKIWGIKNFNLAKLGFNDKYPFLYQFATRKNIDQALNENAASLSNFNRKIVNKYKAGLGLKFLESYLGDSIVKQGIVDFAKINSGKLSHSSTFIQNLKTDKDLTWFENDYLKTNKKIDYTIKKIHKTKDSIEVTILNKRHFTAPIQLYGLKDNEIKFKKWLTGIDSISTIKIPQNGFDRLSLNYDFELPEYNLKNNWKNVERKLLNKPVQLKFLKDVENPYYNQLFYTPVYRFNYYDGLVLGMAISNKTILEKSFQYKLTPSYSTKSNTFSGSYSFIYEYLPEDNNINKFVIGAGGSSFLYAPDLTYNSLTPFALIQFKRKNLRDVSNKVLAASLVTIDKEKSLTQTQHPETNKYSVFNLEFGYSKPDIIDDVRFSTGLEVSSKFSKLSVTAQFRKLTDTNRQFDFRFFAGAFLNNNTETNYFSFALDRPTDYLFQYDYLGRSETSGIFSQQIIINEGGFKSKLPVQYANQFLTTLNTSIGLWRWFEVYTDVGFVKNKNERVFFAHENGVRLNFVQDILEVYFPLHSNLGWEITEPNYSSKIRFVLVIKPKKIYNFIKRGFY
ncbi:aminopeptidase [Lutibacter sp.]|uniref:aminopeptidase n=1 Tax=Lutibacter sp. TaxID=1925666 RepID=UPI001A236594|nr:aminopeptidase [Lutibacter sp.]MBI9042135.1 aminopeptidase [Lutibacter sp.]